MVYKNSQCLINRLNRIVKSTVKHYKSDWTDYDRPKLHTLIKSDDVDDKQLVFIARDCGTWLLRKADIFTCGSNAEYINAYYREDKSAAYYNIDLTKLSVVKA